jgi:hypothetical protein
MSGLRLGDAGRFARTEHDLECAVAVGLFGLDLGDTVVGHVQHRHGNGIAIVREDAHHAHLAAQQPEAFARACCCHGSSPASSTEAFVAHARHRLAGLTVSGDSRRHMALGDFAR